MKHALACCGHAGHADVEPHRAVERGPLVDEDRLQLVAERVGLVVVGEVAAVDAPVGDGVGHPVDHLAQRRLPPGRAEVPAEVLLGGDVRRVLRPGDRELHGRAARRRPSRPSSC